MSSQEIRIVELSSFRYVRFHGFGEGPEGIAIDKAMQWAEKHDYFNNKGIRWFGFNNPDPTPGSINYGYEIWLTIPQGMQVEDMEVLDYEGGYYAVSHCAGTIDQAGEFIPGAWKALVEWVENSVYQMAKHQWFEEQLGEKNLTPDKMLQQGKMSLDLFLPISKV